jgi:hypothetical protein
MGIERFSSSIYLGGSVAQCGPTCQRHATRAGFGGAKRGICAPRIHAVNKVLHARAKWFSRTPVVSWPGHAAS